LTGLEVRSYTYGVWLCVV